MKLSQTAAYALHATLQLARSTTGEPVPCSHLAATSAMPERFLLQVLRNLTLHGILHATRGVSGGYLLNRQPEEISLWDLIEAVEAGHAEDCAAAQVLPILARDKVLNALRRSGKAERAILNGLTVADLLPH